jgi:hypothetical protein
MTDAISPSGSAPQPAPKPKGILGAIKADLGTADKSIEHAVGSLVPDQIKQTPKMPAYHTLSPTQRVTAEQNSAGATYPVQEIQSSNGTPHEPVNVVVAATKEELVSALENAGWHQADQLNTVTGLKTLGTLADRLPLVRDVVHYNYQSAPVSDQYLHGRVSDMAFEKNANHDLCRDHIRIWDSGQKSPDGRPIWEIAATRDIGVDVHPKTKHSTHLVDKNIDLERDQLVADLLDTGAVQGYKTAQAEMSSEHLARVDKSYQTDHKVYMLDLTPRPDITNDPIEHGNGLVRSLFHATPGFVQDGVHDLDGSITKFMKNLTG